MKTKHFLLATLMFVSLGLAAQNCNDIVMDNIGVVRNPSTIIDAAQPLINQGADVHVVLVDSLMRYGSRLADVESFYERVCANWRGADGLRKRNLIVLMVYPAQRSKNAFFGDAYKPAFPQQNDAERLYSKAANGYFGNALKGQPGQWEVGFASALTAFNREIASYYQRREQAKNTPQSAPVTYTPQPQQPSEPIHWGIILFIFALIAATGMGIIWFVSWRKNKEEAEAAQQQAIDQQTRAGTLLRQAETKYKDQDKTTTYDALFTEFSRLSNLLSNDPTEKGLTPEQYNVIGARWKSLADRLQALIVPVPKSKSEAKRYSAMSGTKVEPQPDSHASVSSTTRTAPVHTHTERIVERVYDSTPIYDPSPFYVPVPVETTVVERVTPADIERSNYTSEWERPSIRQDDDADSVFSVSSSSSNNDYVPDPEPEPTQTDDPDSNF